MENLQQIAEKLKELGIEEVKKLAAILESDIETDLGLVRKGIQIASVPVSCPKGQILDPATGQCIDDPLPGNP